MYFCWFKHISPAFANIMLVAVFVKMKPNTRGFSSHPRGFSIQTNGNLPKTGSILRGKKTPTDMLEIGATDLITIGKEVTAYLKEHGSTSQKKAIR